MAAVFESAREAHFDSALAKQEAEIDATEHRNEMIADTAANLYAARMAALCDDDIICALQSAVGKHLCSNIRKALITRDPISAFSALSSLVSCWVLDDSQTEALQAIERLESADHPARH